MGSYLDKARQFEARRHAERRTAPQRTPLTVVPSASETCRHCGHPVAIESVEPSRDGQRMLTYWRCDPCETAGVTPDTPGTPTVKDPRPVSIPGTRDFLPRPLGKETEDCWEAWEGLMVWLIEHQPEHYYSVCEAEDVLSSMERQGVTSGVEYENACTALIQRFETARRLALSARAKVWLT